MAEDEVLNMSPANNKLKYEVSIHKISEVILPDIDSVEWYTNYSTFTVQEDYYYLTDGDFYYETYENNRNEQIIEVTYNKGQVDYIFSYIIENDNIISDRASGRYNNSETGDNYSIFVFFDEEVNVFRFEDEFSNFTKLDEAALTYTCGKYVYLDFYEIANEGYYIIENYNSRQYDIISAGDTTPISANKRVNFYDEYSNYEFDLQLIKNIPSVEDIIAESLNHEEFEEFTMGIYTIAADVHPSYYNLQISFNDGDAAIEATIAKFNRHIMINYEASGQSAKYYYFYEGKVYIYTNEAAPEIFTQELIDKYMFLTDRIYIS